MSENEKHLQIGQQLKDARVANGYTLDDLQQATKIQKRYLIAIEDEKFDELPGDFYVRAFVKQYADTVGLDGNELLKDYDDYLPKTKTTEYSEHLSQAVETRRGSHKVTTDGFDRARKYIPTAIVGAIVVIILGAIWVTTIIKNHADSATKIDSSSVSVSGESSRSSKKKASSSSSKQKESKLKLTEASRTSTSVVYNTTATLKKSTDLTVKAGTNALYTSVNVDNTSRLAKTLQAKQTGSVTLAKTAKKVVITLGSASGVTIKLGNQTLNFTNNNRYPSTRVITINFGSSSTQTSSASASSSSISTATTTGTTGTTRTTTGTTTTSTSQRTTGTTTTGQSTTTANNQRTTTATTTNNTATTTSR